MHKLTIIPYRSFGNGTRVYVSGHIFESYGVKPPARGSLFQNLVQMFKRYTLKPAPHISVIVHIGDKKFPLVADAHGFYKGTLDVALPEKKMSYTVTTSDNEALAKSYLYIFGQTGTGVLSDIDDTILLSYVNQWYRMFWLLIAKNALTRHPVPQISRILETIQGFNNNVLPSDFYYVSNSEWNLYDFLVDFFEENNLPDGVFMLQRFKEGFRDALFSSHEKDNHKPESLRFILDFFGEKKFILLGDNGQRDLEIYSNICKEYTSRIEAVIIRDVGKLKYRQKNKSFEESILALDIPVKHIR